MIQKWSTHSDPIVFAPPLCAHFPEAVEKSIPSKEETIVEVS
jgi:hypothetical protein